MRTETEKKYLRARVQDSSSAGLVIILFDLLIADIERVIAAIAEGNIEKRGMELNHAFLVLQQLEDSLDRENGGEAAQTFSAFYSAIRAKLLEAHIKISPELFRRQIELLLDVRQAWQQADQSDLMSKAENLAPVATRQMRINDASLEEVSTANWTA